MFWAVVEIMDKKKQLHIYGVISNLFSRQVERKRAMYSNFYSFY